MKFWRACITAGARCSVLQSEVIKRGGGRFCCRCVPLLQLLNLEDPTTTGGDYIIYLSDI